MITRGNALKAASALLGGLMLLFGLLPMIVYGYFNIGMVALILLGSAFAGLPLLWDRFPRRAGPGRPRPPQKWWRTLRKAWAMGLAVFLTAEILFSAVMLSTAYTNPPPADEEVTVVVLGCLTIGDQPSRMLRHRLEAALEYLGRFPAGTKIPVVVSGGKGDAETVSEARVMAGWLVAHGADPEMIYLEDRSTDTAENLAFSEKIIAENDLPRRVVIVSDGFHLLRGGIYARRNGLEPFAVPSATPLVLLPSFWLREQLAIIAAVLSI